MTDSSAYDSPKPTDKGEAEVRNLRLNYRSSTNTKRIKTHRPSSDDESFSSSLLPIPDNLRQKGGDLKKIVSDVEEATVS